MLTLVACKPITADSREKISFPINTPFKESVSLLPQLFFLSCDRHTPVKEAQRQRVTEIHTALTVTFLIVPLFLDAHALIFL